MPRRWTSDRLPWKGVKGRPARQDRPCQFPIRRNTAAPDEIENERAIECARAKLAIKPGVARTRIREVELTEPITVKRLLGE